MWGLRLKGNRWFHDDWGVLSFMYVWKRGVGFSVPKPLNLEKPWARAQLLFVSDPVADLLAAAVVRRLPPHRLGIWAP